MIKLKDYDLLDRMVAETALKYDITFAEADVMLKDKLEKLEEKFN